MGFGCQTASLRQKPNLKEKNAKRQLRSPSNHNVTWGEAVGDFPERYTPSLSGSCVLWGLRLSPGSSTQKRIEHLRFGLILDICARKLGVVAQTREIVTAQSRTNRNKMEVLLPTRIWQSDAAEPSLRLWKVHCAFVVGTLLCTATQESLVLRDNLVSIEQSFCVPLPSSHQPV